MANSTDPAARSVHGTNPQNLVENITRQKIYSMPFWKEKCFGASAERVVDLAYALRDFGGIYGQHLRCTDFMCLVLKLLQIQPEKEIVVGVSLPTPSCIFSFSSTAFSVLWQQALTTLCRVQSSLRTRTTSMCECSAPCTCALSAALSTSTSIWNRSTTTIAASGEGSPRRVPPSLSRARLVYAPATLTAAQLGLLCWRRLVPICCCRLPGPFLLFALARLLSWPSLAGRVPALPRR